MNKENIIKKILLVFLVAMLTPNSVFAGGMIDDPLLANLVVDQLEIRDVEGSDPLVWEAEAWLGYDLHKLWLKTDGEYSDGQLEEAEVQALYSRAIAPFWDVQIGWRRDICPRPDRDWLALGIKGLAPYFFDIDAAVFVGDSGRSAVRLQAEYEIMFSQRLILVPDIEVNISGRADDERELGAGLTDIEAGLRLRYEIVREFAPYIGLNWLRLYGDTADFARQDGKGDEDFQLVAGFRAWF